ncbi:MAG: ATP synthase F1 subunit delta [Myxococcaceae bacterium]|jgi:F-type H+-transporting ATPase subunit delta|nr:ATP synthase F1 subunit delta [Myxococcaceae bacterium]
MQNVSVARRYARALLAASQDSADQVLAQLDELVRYLHSAPDVLAALSNPALSRAQRMAMTEGLIKAAPGIALTLANTLRLLTDRNRFASLPSLALQFRDLVDVRMGRVRGSITSATVLGEAQLVAIKAQLEALTQRTVVLEPKVDPSILGGVVATVGSRTYDGSLKSQLREMGRQLLTR